MSLADKLPEEARFALADAIDGMEFVGVDAAHNMRVGGSLSDLIRTLGYIRTGLFNERQRYMTERDNALKAKVAMLDDIDAVRRVFNGTSRY